MSHILLKNAKLVNENQIITTDVWIQGERIERIDPNITPRNTNYTVIDVAENYLFPGMIDDQVHFREPGLTHKGNIASESRAAIAGGITSYMEQPNTVPNTVTFEELNHKFQIASQTSFANYSFMFGGTNDNLELIKQINPKNVAALKLFLGSSTGNMLVDNEKVLEQIFKNAPLIITTHCEDEHTIRENLEHYKTLFPNDIPAKYHPIIRSAEACYLSSSKAIALAKQTNAKLHIFHVSTALETELFSNQIPLSEKKITAEACVHHLWFTDADYETKGNFIKWNPAVKSETDREALWKALLDDRIDLIATDHAPHTLSEKQNGYLNCPSGGPLVQHALPALLQSYILGKISLEKIVQKTAHNPAILYQIIDRGFVREGYYADLTIANLNKPYTIQKSNIEYACGWSPFEGETFTPQITDTFVNGNWVFQNGNLNSQPQGKQLFFNR